MHWQIMSLIILPLLSAQMLLHNINFSSQTFEVYNMPFSLEELQDALRRTHGTAAGPDEI